MRGVRLTSNGGRTWSDATLQPALASFSWVRWHFDGQHRVPGDVERVARATDGDGGVQSVEERPPEPSGATGYPRITVRVGAEDDSRGVGRARRGGAANKIRAARARRALSGKDKGI